MDKRTLLAREVALRAKDLIGYKYDQVAGMTLKVSGKKVKFRVIVSDKARELSKINEHNFQKNRKNLIEEFELGGTERMFDFYKKELKKAEDKLYK